MKTKKTKKIDVIPSPAPVMPEVKPTENTEVKVIVAKNPEQRTGLRGLRGLVFDRFAQAFAKTNDFSGLPSMEEMTKEVAEKFPQSRWIARPKIHYSYYKSKYISSTQVK